MFKRLGQNHAIYLLLALVVAFPLVKPIGLPLTVSKSVQESFNLIEALPNGGTILMIWDLSASAFMDAGATGTAFLAHLFRKDMKVIGVTFQETALGSFPKALRALSAKDLIYGEDYVDLGFVAGDEPSLAAVVQDLHSSVQLDRFGSKLTDLPITANIRSVADTILVISMSGGRPGTEAVARQVAQRFSVPIVSACTAGEATVVTVLRSSGHIDGMVAGLKGGAEYEQLVKRPAYGTSSMDALSMLNLYIVGLLVVGNVLHFRGRWDKRKEVTGNEHLD